MSGHSLTAAGTIYPELQYTPTDFLVVNSLELGTLTGEPTPEAPFVSLIDPPNYASPGSSVKSDKASSVDSGIFAPIKQLRLLTQLSLPAVPNIPECRAAQATLSLTNTERRQILDSEDDHLLNVPEVNFSKSKLLKSNTSRTSAAQCRICFSGIKIVVLCDLQHFDVLYCSIRGHFSKRRWTCFGPSLRVWWEYSVLPSGVSAPVGTAEWFIRMRTLQNTISNKTERLEQVYPGIVNSKIYPNVFWQSGQWGLNWVMNSVMHF